MHSVTNFEIKIIMDIDALSHLPTLHNKFLQELNLNGLCQYNNMHQMYLFENPNQVVNFSYIIIFLRLSKFYIISPHTHRWYKFNANDIFENHN